MSDLKSLFCQGLSEQEFYKDLKEKEIKKNAGTNAFSAQTIKLFFFIKRLIMTSMYCSRLYAWRSTQ